MFLLACSVGFLFWAFRVFPGVCLVAVTSKEHLLSVMIFSRRKRHQLQENRGLAPSSVFRALASRSSLFSDLSKQNKIGGRLKTIMSLRIEYR